MLDSDLDYVCTYVFYIQDGNIDQRVVETQWQLTHTVWEKRFKVACCFAGSDDVHQLAYREVAEIFAHLFCDTNVVMSDIGAGKILSKYIGS